LQTATMQKRAECVCIVYAEFTIKSFS